MQDSKDEESPQNKFSEFVNSAGKEVAKVTDMAKKKVSDDVSWVGDRAKETVSKFNEEVTKERAAAEEMFARFDQFMNGAKKKFEQHKKGQQPEEKSVQEAEKEVESKERMQKWWSAWQQVGSTGLYHDVYDNNEAVSNMTPIKTSKDEVWKFGMKYLHKV